MSMLGGHGGVAELGEIVLSAPEYSAAQKAVSKLIAGDVPAKEITIVGVGVRTVEKVTGRLGLGSAARSGIINGVLIGLFIGAIMVLTSPEAPIQLFAGFLFIGVAIGMFMSFISYLIVRRKRDYASVMQLSADTYEVRVLASSFAKAREVLGGGRSPVARTPVNLDEPPRYGERIVPGSDAGAGVVDAGTGVSPETSVDSQPTQEHG